MKRFYQFILALVLLMQFVWVAFASPDALTLSGSTVDGGGGSSSGGTYTLNSSIGQPEAGIAMSGGNYEARGGFLQGGSTSLGCTVLTGVAIDGRTNGQPDSYTFTANVTPDEASGPLTYTWSPAPDSGQGTQSATYNLTEAGEHTISVTVENCDGNGTANNEYTITITPLPSGAILRTDNYNVAVDGSVTVKVEADNLPSPGLAAANVSLSYDSSVIRPTSCTVDTAFTGTCNTNSSGVVQLNILSGSGVSGDFDIVEIVFEAVGQANDSSTLDLNVNQFADSNGSAIGVTVQDGSVTIGQTLGDVSCDDQVTVVDALYILQYDVGIRSASQQCPLADNTLLLANCDVNNDNSCNSIDALFILQCDVGISNVFCPARSGSSASSQDQPTQRAGSATGAPRGGATVEIASVEIDPLGTVSLPVTANIGDAAMSAASIELHFDASVVQVESCSVPLGFFGSCNTDNEQGMVSFNALSTSGVTGNVTLADISFVAGQSGSTTLDIQIKTFVDASGNSIEVSDVDGQISITSTATCTVVTGVIIDGATNGQPDSYTFTANVTPDEASGPLTYTWSPAPDSGEGTESATYNLTEAGEHTISVTVSNCDGNGTTNDEHTITITADTCTSVTGVIIDGAASGPPDSYTFNANITPDEASEPLTYSWYPAPDSEEGTQSATYNLTEDGDYTINVTATNCDGSGTGNDSHVITIMSEGDEQLSLSGVESSSSQDGWPTAHLIDGNTDSSWSSVGHFEHLASSEWAAALLPGRMSVTRMRIYPRVNPVTTDRSLGFPKDFVIQYSYNGDGLTCDPNDARFGDIGNWRPLITEFGYAQPSNEAIDFTFSSQQVQCVRIMGAELSQDDYGNRFMQFNQLELYDGASKLNVTGVQTSSNQDGWPATHLIDGNTDSSWSSVGHFEHLASSEWAAALLPGRMSVTRMRIYPRVNPVTTDRSLGFPKDFVIQYSYNGDGLTCDPNDTRFGNIGNWRPLITEFGYAQPSNEAIDFTFSSQQVQCVRIMGAELSQDDYGNRFMQFNQLELYDGASKLNVTGVQTSSSEGGWPATHLIDGNTDSSWSSVGHFDHLASSEWAAALLPGRMSVTRMRIYPRVNPVTTDRSLGFPKDFVIQYSYNGDGLTCDPNDARFGDIGNWRPLITEFGYAQPSNEAIDFTFSSQQVQCVRIMGAELSQDDYGNRFMQFNEIQLFGPSTSAHNVAGSR